MKTTRILVCVAAILLAQLAPESRAQANNKPPGKISFQGFLTDSSGNPLGNAAPTNLTVYFKLYKNASGTAAADKLWAEKQVVTIDRGHFSVLLGEGIATGDGSEPHSVDLTSYFVGGDVSDRYLGIRVEGQSEVAPRMQFLAAPFAHLAQYANNLVSPNGASILNANIAGNIGIGTLSPERKLQIGDESGTSEGMLRFESRSGGMMRAWEIGVPGGTESNLGKNYSFVIDDVGSNGSGGGTGPEFMIRWGTGFVGIGTTNPASLLDVNGTITALNYTGGNYSGNGSGLTALNANNLATGTVNSDRLPGTIGGDKTFTGHIGFTAGKRIDLGIGAARADGNNGVIGYGVFNANALDIVGGGAGSGDTRKIMFHAQGGSQHHGWLGINREPRAPIDIGAVGGSLWFGTFGYLDTGGAGVWTHNGNLPVSLYAENRIYAWQFNAFSDARIKNIAGQSDTKQDLALIKRLRVTDYRSKDFVAEGTALRKGFIAQEVEQIIPEAVERSTNWAPNIYARASDVKVDNGRQLLTLTLTNAHELKVGDKVRLFTDGGRFEVPVSKILETNKFVINDWTNSVKDVFVFGKEIDDFRSLNYDRIFTTGIGAIQELAARLEEKSTQVNALEKRVAELEKMVTRLATLQDGKARASVTGK